MSDIEDTKQCTNCKLEVPSGNFIIHSVHCQRNFYLCSKCDQPVNYSSRGDHDEANHTVVHCPNCNLELEKYLLDDHLTNDCPDREVKCQICDIDVKASDLAEHENYCGSRTEKCPECEEFVMLKYKSLHIDSNHTFIKLSDEPGPSPSWQYGKRTLCNFLPDMSSKSSTNVAVRKRKSRENFRKSRSSGSSESKDDFDEMSKKSVDSPPNRKDSYTGSKVGNEFRSKEKSARDLNEWPALSSLRSLQISEGTDKKPNRRAASYSNQNTVDEDSDLFYAIKVSHEINSDIWRKEVNKKDETLKNSFQPLTDKEFKEKLVKKDMFEEGAKKVDQEQNDDIFRNDLNCLYDEQETVKLPCEFCGNLIASNFLILHQTSCSLYMTESYPGRSKQNNRIQFDEDLEPKISCVNCNRFFRLSHFENHQLHCRRVRTAVGYGSRTTSSLLTTMGSGSGLELLKNHDDDSNNLNHPDSGVITKTTKVSRKNRRAPSPPRR